MLAATTTSASAFFKASSGKYPVTIFAHTAIEQVFTAAGVPVKCEEATFEGSLLGEGSQLTVRPSYSKCIAEGFKTTVHPNGCVYNFHQAKGALEGQVSIECPSGKSIEFEVASGCTLKVGAAGNQFRKNIKFNNVTNEGTAELVSVEAIVTEITFEASGGFLCGKIPAKGLAEYKSGLIHVDGYQAEGGVNKEVSILVV
jgi:hypothetical protein